MTAGYTQQIMVPLSRGDGICAFTTNGELVLATYQVEGDTGDLLHHENPSVRAYAHIHVLGWARDHHATIED